MTWIPRRLHIGFLPKPVLAAVLAGLVLCMSVPAFGRVSAQQSPDCEDPETVACIPISSSNQMPDGAGAVAPTAPRSAAAAAPAAPAATPRQYCPPPYPPPYPGPYPVPQAAGGSSSAAGPLPPLPAPCFNDVYSTINRANLAYARAMRSLDSSQLYQYWAQDSLQQLLGQISALRSTNSYRVLKLASINVLEQNIYPGYGWVHTSEHWITATWSYAGYQIDSSDAWYDNQYYLYQSGSRWIIGTDVVN